jgi:hypothetical protein
LQVARGVAAAHCYRDDVIELKLVLTIALNASSSVSLPDFHTNCLRNRLTPSWIVEAFGNRL